ncbi:MAG TPA: DUF397 domain-containing protein [Pseudonocardiaceae bacterium]|nr:DUF397 domain-containing protein [Pseudonocardiaceae bacterium]
MRTIPDSAWYTSSRSSGAQNCVEVAHGPGWTAVRDSKNPAGPALVFSHREWQAFIEDPTH